MIDKIITFEKMEFGLMRKLSNCFDISFSELVNTAPSLTPVVCHENIIRGYTVSFGSNTCVHTLKKIKKLSAEHKVHLHFYIVNNLLTPETKK